MLASETPDQNSPAAGEYLYTLFMASGLIFIIIGVVNDGYSSWIALGISLTVIGLVLRKRRMRTHS